MDEVLLPGPLVPCTADELAAAPFGGVVRGRDGLAMPVEPDGAGRIRIGGLPSPASRLEVVRGLGYAFERRRAPRRLATPDGTALRVGSVVFVRDGERWRTSAGRVEAHDVLVDALARSEPHAAELIGNVRETPAYVAARLRALGHAGAVVLDLVGVGRAA